MDDGGFGFKDIPDRDEPANRGWPGAEVMSHGVECIRTQNIPCLLWEPGRSLDEETSGRFQRLSTLKRSVHGLGAWRRLLRASDTVCLEHLAINVAVCMVAFGRSHVPSNASSWIAVAVDERPLEILDCIDSKQSLASISHKALIRTLLRLHLTWILHLIALPTGELLT